MADEYVDNGESGGDFLDRAWWFERAQEGALIAVKINRVEDPTVLQVGMKAAEPVNVDFVILNGSEEGTVYRGERIIASGIVNTLRTRKVKNPKTGKMVSVPREPGQNVAIRLGVYKAFGREHPGANPCGPDELAKVNKVFADTDGDPYTYYEKRALADLDLPAPDNADPVTVPADDDDLPF